MRGSDEQTGALFSYVSCEARVPADHPLRLIRAVVDEALDVLSPEFDRWYARVGRCGTRAPSARTAIGCWPGTSRSRCWPPRWGR
jgi:hypothetical protein